MKGLLGLSKLVKATISSTALINGICIIPSMRNYPSTVESRDPSNDALYYHQDDYPKRNCDWEGSTKTGSVISGSLIVTGNDNHLENPTTVSCRLIKSSWYDVHAGAFSYENLVSTLKRLCQQPRHPSLIGSFSAASNITGITLNMKRVARIMHRYGGIVAFDCAVWASHLPVGMDKVTDGPEASADAIFLSPHNLPGGPG